MNVKIGIMQPYILYIGYFQLINLVTNLYFMMMLILKKDHGLIEQNINK